MIKYNRKQNTFIIIDKNRTMIYDSRVAFIDLKALSLKDESENEDINKLIAYMIPLMINATDRNVINHDNCIIYFNKLPKLNNIKIQNDVLTQEMIMGNGIKNLSTIGGIISFGLFTFSYIYLNMISGNAGTVAMGASTMLSRVSTSVNVGYVERLHEEYINDEDGTLNREGQKYLNRLFEINEEFRDEIINFVRDKTELDLDMILDKRYKTNMLNMTGKKYLAECRV